MAKKHNEAGKVKKVHGRLFKDHIQTKSAKSFINKEIDYSKKVIDPITKKDILLGKSKEKKPPQLVIKS